MNPTTPIFKSAILTCLIALSIGTHASAEPDAVQADPGKKADTHQLRITPSHPLYSQIARALNQKELKPGSKITIEIAPTSDVARAKLPEKQLPNPSFLNNLLRVRNTGNKGRPDTIVTTATRSGNQPNVKLVALSPSQDAATIRSQPRLWWHQSESTLGAELEFVLTEINGTNTQEIFRRPIPPMSSGYHVIDLSHASINPAGIALKTNKTYQWTINLRSGASSAPVYCRIKYTPKLELEKSVLTTPTHPDTLTALGKAGNWYELYDAIASLSVRYPKEKRFTSARDELLRQSGLSTVINKK